MDVAVIVIFVLFSVPEIVSLKKTKQQKELFIYIILFSLSFITSILLALGVKFPSFDRYIGEIISSITKE